MDRIDEAVVVAMDARRRSYGRTTLGSKEAQDFEAMRAAILASHPVLLGEPVACDVVDPYGVVVAERVTVGRADEIIDQLEFSNCEKARYLYAPSLGEGHE